MAGDTELPVLQPSEEIDVPEFSSVTNQRLFGVNRLCLLFRLPRTFTLLGDQVFRNVHFLPVFLAISGLLSFPLV